jgi:2-dehydro-3-deoxyphosphooctonate aldolase (KDO 8-P synthase)
LHRMKDLLESLVAIDSVVKSSGSFLEDSFK